MELIWKLISKLKGFIKYGAVGTIGFGVHLLVLWVLTDYAQLWYILSAIIAVIIAAINNYILNYVWTFSDKKKNINNKVIGYFKYLLGRGFTEGLYLGLLYLMTDIANIHYMTSAVLVQILTAIVGYYIAIKWIWAKAKHNNGRSYVTAKN
jgi:dolichol-phosphate mannosyltransferase